MLKSNEKAVRDASIELVQLLDKMNKLDSALLNKSLMNKLGKEQEDLMSAQSTYMWNYANTLVQRLDLMTKGNDELKAIYEAIVPVWGISL